MTGLLFLVQQGDWARCSSVGHKRRQKTFHEGRQNLFIFLPHVPLVHFPPSLSTSSAVYLMSSPLLSLFHILTTILSLSVTHPFVPFAGASASLAMPAQACMYQLRTTLSKE